MHFNILLFVPYRNSSYISLASLFHFQKEITNIHYTITKDTISKLLYDNLNWNRTLIVGSCALKNFEEQVLHRQVDWNPNDIDILIACSSAEEFKEYVNDIVLKTKGETTGAYHSLLFYHPEIICIVNCKFPFLNKTIQFLGIKTEFSCLVSKWLSITDSPSFVSYKIHNNSKIYNVKKDLLPNLKTKIFNWKYIWNFNRICKYSDRGYIFTFGD